MRFYGLDIIQGTLEELDYAQGRETCAPMIQASILPPCLKEHWRG